ncbi:hypothetical protein DW033_15535 [Parabacteroides sp. AF39-10AC]|nr:hypothetical protein DW033_15535 [Parabacteroides sp. AF39-10AC]
MKAFLCFMYIYDLPQMMWKQRVIVKILFILRTLFIFHRKTRTCFLKNMSNFSKKTYMFSEKHARLFGALIIK